MRQREADTEAEGKISEADKPNMQNGFALTCISLSKFPYIRNLLHLCCNNSPLCCCCEPFRISINHLLKYALEQNTQDVHCYKLLSVSVEDVWGTAKRHCRNQRHFNSNNNQYKRNMCTKIRNIQSTCMAEARTRQRSGSQSVICKMLPSFGQTFCID